MANDAPVVVAFDPGGITGWSVIKVHPEALCTAAPILGNIEHWAHGQIISPANDTAEQACVDDMVALVAQWPGCAVLIEDFILRMLTTGRDLLSPVRLTAMLCYALNKELGIEVTHRQQPSEAKTVATDERLKNWGLYERDGGLEHARDADRHAILWLRKAKDPVRGAARRALWWPKLYGVGGPYYAAPQAAKPGGVRTVQLVNAEEGATAPSKLAEVTKPVFKAARKGTPVRKRSSYK